MCLCLVLATSVACLRPKETTMMTATNITRHTSMLLRRAAILVLELEIHHVFRADRPTSPLQFAFLLPPRGTTGKMHLKTCKCNAPTVAPAATCTVLTTTNAKIPAFCSFILTSNETLPKFMRAFHSQDVSACKWWDTVPAKGSVVLQC